MDRLKEKKYVVMLTEGSYEAFRQLYDHFSPLLYGFALRLSGSHDHAAELVQETFVKVWVSRSRIDRDKPFKAYLFSIARNSFIDMLRKKVRIAGMDMAAMVAQVVEDGGESIDRQYLGSRMQAAQEKLSPRQKEIFILNKIDGLSVREISSKLGIGEQTIYNQLSSALRILRRELGDGPLLSLLLIYFTGC